MSIGYATFIFLLQNLQKKNGGRMSVEVFFKLLIAASGIGGAIFGFFRWLREYRLRLRLKQFKLLQLYRDRFRTDPILSKVHDYFVNRKGPKPRDSAVYFYLGQFEELYLLTKLGLIEQGVVFNFFGWYAKLAAGKYGVSSDRPWTVLHEFVTAYEKSAERMAQNEEN